MNGKDVEQTIREVVAEFYGVSIDTVRRDTEFKNLPGDSLDFVEVTLELEDQLETEIETEKAESCQTIGALADLLKR